MRPLPPRRSLRRRIVLTALAVVVYGIAVGLFILFDLLRG